MANDYINAYTRLVHSRMRRTDQSVESSMRSFQSALADWRQAARPRGSRISKILARHTRSLFVRHVSSL